MRDAAPTVAADPAQPRAIGAVEISVKRRGAGSVLEDLRQSGSMRVLFPRPSSPPTAMLLNTAGGVTGGDRFDVSARCAPDTELTLTTQAAERAYAAQPGPAGRIRNALRVGSGALLRWLPQETILYDGCALERSLEVDLDAGAQALIVEPVVFGRAAHGESVRCGTFRDRIALRRNGRAIFTDAVTLQDDMAAKLAHPTTGHNAGAMAMLILAAPHAADHLERLREICAEKTGDCPNLSTGISALDPDLLVLRSLAHDSYDLRQVLLPILDHLTGNRLPLCWRL